MKAVASQITAATIIYSTVCSGADQIKHGSSESLAFARVSNRWPVNSPYTWPVTRKMFPFDDGIIVECLAAAMAESCHTYEPRHVSGFNHTWIVFFFNICVAIIRYFILCVAKNVSNVYGSPRWPTIPDKREYTINHQSQYSKTWHSKCLASMAQMVWAFGMNPKVGWFESPSGGDIFCLKNFDTFSRTSLCVSKINVVAHAQLTFWNVNSTSKIADKREYTVCRCLRRYIVTTQSSNAEIT